jgi:hypothetical protein
MDPVKFHPIQSDYKFTIEPYPSGRFGFNDDFIRQYGIGSVWTRTHIQTDGLEPLLTLEVTKSSIPCIIFAIGT